MSDRPPFLLSYTPTVDELERLYLLRQGPRVTWLLRLAPGFITCVGVLALATGDTVAGTVFTPLGVLLGIGVLRLWWLRTRTLYQSNPNALAPISEVLDGHGVTATSAAGVTSTVPWTYWKVAHVTPDLIALFTSGSRLASGGYLPRRGLTEPERWDELVTFVVARVPLHPRSPVKAWRYGPT